MDSVSPRSLTDPQGNVLHVHVAPSTALHGVRGHLNVLTFTRPDGKWVGSVSLYPHVRVERLTEQELLGLLRRAVSRHSIPKVAPDPLP